jgi:hypothetical protein
LILGLGQIMPVAGVFRMHGLPQALCGAALVLNYVGRLCSMRRFHQHAVSVALHPFGVLLLLAIQWHAFLRNLVGTKEAWKGRSYKPAST